jgi:hypothetical protein
MKRRIEEFDKEIKYQRVCAQESSAEFIERTVFLLKTGYYECDFAVELVYKYVDIINYTIISDDNVLLDIIVNNWSKFSTVFETNKVIYKKLIIENSSRKCFEYFKNVLGQNFKPESYYETARFCSYIK